MLQKWITVGRLTDLPKPGARVVKLPHGTIGVFRTIDDECFALEDRCPHRGGPLSQGIVYGRSVACPLHDWRIALDTGQAVAPDRGCVARYPVRVKDGMVELLCVPEVCETA